MEVEVDTVGLTYSGKLVEISDAEIQLETPQGWVSIPVGQVTCIRRKCPEDFFPGFDFPG
jgi:hypothetical protein